mmetsp:Transcript_21814/g.32873  ORF Transcript_21814/g.32873 Transcript_21814/m.32873 type:complete len:124 (+) Transcript_21814:105-476(+)
MSRNWDHHVQLRRQAGLEQAALEPPAFGQRPCPAECHPFPVPAALLLVAAALKVQVTFRDFQGARRPWIARIPLTMKEHGSWPARCNFSFCILRVSTGALCERRIDLAVIVLGASPGGPSQAS